MTNRKTIPIAVSTIEQLREFAETVLQLKIHPNAKRETIIDRIEVAHQGDSITVPEVEQEPILSTIPSPANEPPPIPPAEKVRIYVETQDIPGGDKPVAVSVNGRAMLIPRGKEVDVPRPYVHVLQNAVRDIYDPLEGGGISTTPRKVPSYPFRVIADPAPHQSKAA